MDDGKIIDPGVYQSKTECEVKRCDSNGGFEFTSCGVMQIQGCETGDLVDVSLDYPECCSQYFHCANGTTLKMR